ncbi:MAG TPA: HD-GYP domain-containing protein [Xanthomonadaceae bacterium]|nr:HD-GYP domain-containing protein [Xanthomonadaceae bacterium]
MKLEEVELEPDMLSQGMYVCRLDRPWSDSPFLLQGFFVQEESQLAWVREHCRSVWIDLERSVVSEDVAPRVPLAARAARPAHETRAPARPAAPTLPATRTQYTNQVGFLDELPAARKAHDNALRTAMMTLADVQAGRNLVADNVSMAANAVVDSVLRNADTLFWVNALQRHGSYAYGHAINCCALAAAFGRHLGLPAESLVDLAAGGLLLDIGKTRLPETLLRHTGPLGEGDMAQVREHVAHGVDILAHSRAGWGPAVVDMLRTHHERWDGSGYPDGLAGHAIPLFGRMAAIIDSFDAMTSERPHVPAQARHEALQELYRNRDRLYHGELVEQFTGCLGVYPTGSLVELNTGEVAVVMTQNPTRRLRPLVMLLTNAAKVPLREFRQLDLMTLSPTGGASGVPSIDRALPVGAYGLDPAELFL